MKYGRDHEWDLESDSPPRDHCNPDRDWYSARDQVRERMTGNDPRRKTEKATMTLGRSERQNDWWFDKGYTIIVETSTQLTWGQWANIHLSMH